MSPSTEPLFTIIHYTATEDTTRTISFTIIFPSFPFNAFLYFVHRHHDQGNRSNKANQSKAKQRAACCDVAVPIPPRTAQSE
ncbi:hypothetical protein E2C01_079849 [Portunus trituberculatus]|uniref:Uncharacterized protein n=1 Tax=Portunus trituberculatus TaxID=210409 RepID=A0A5B7IKL6_PORTR|nr:hypothetical protein [Portunus trituberculatus]